jgi:hypothetical protein
MQGRDGRGPTSLRGLPQMLVSIDIGNNRCVVQDICQRGGELRRSGPARRECGTSDKCEVLKVVRITGNCVSR